MASGCHPWTHCMFPTILYGFDPFFIYENNNLFFLLHRDENGYYVDMFDQPQTVPMSTYLVAFTIAELYYIETYYRNISVCMQYSLTCHQYLHHPKQHTVNWEIFASSIFYRTCSMIVIFTLCFSQFCW